VSAPLFPGKKPPTDDGKADEQNGRIGHAHVVDGHDVGTRSRDVFTADYYQPRQNNLDNSEEKANQSVTKHSGIVNCQL
jgi:hypothetical protein